MPALCTPLVLLVVMLVELILEFLWVVNRLDFEAFCDCVDNDLGFNIQNSYERGRSYNHLELVRGLDRNMASLSLLASENF